MTRRRLARVHRATKDGGQIATAVMIVVFVGMLAAVMMILLPTGQATDQKAGAQAAADAAALGAASEIRDQIPALIVSALASVQDPAGLSGLLTTLGSGLGRTSALDFASRNNADVISYQFTPSIGVVNVQVRSRDTASTGKHAVSGASARIGPRLGPCVLDAGPVASPPVPADPAAPPAPTGIGVSCGDLHLHITFPGIPGTPVLDTTLTELRNQFRPRLIG
jgi:hypothetical protein